MAWHRIADILNGAVAPGTDVTVKGWVRTRRDSKAGLSFLHVHDGSGFDPIQVVAPSALANYQDDVLRLTTGCSVEIDGVLVPSEGKGQRFEIKAASVRVVGWVEDPDTYPISPKRHTYEYLREVAHLQAADQHVRRGGAGPPRARAGHPPLLPRARLLLGAHADHHRQRHRGGGRAVPRLDARSREPAADGGRRRSTSRRTSSASRRS